MPPERKTVIRITDDGLPFLTQDAFVKVEADMSPGQNRPHDYGYITMCYGIGGTAIYDVRYTPAYDGGCTHRRISLTCSLPVPPFKTSFQRDSSVLKELELRPLPL